MEKATNEKENQGKVIDIRPTPRQMALIQCPADTIFFGGGRGGGKTYGIGLLVLERVIKYGKNFHAIFFRRSYPELDDAINKYKELFGGYATFISSKNTFRFQNGAWLRMAFLDKKDDVEKYQGHEYALIIFDEVTNFPSFNYVERMRGSLRNAHGIPTQLILSGNPGGPLQQRLMMDFITPYPQGEVLLDDGYSNIQKRRITRCYIPSHLDDNPYLKDTEYRDNLLKSGTPEQVRQWLGDWYVSQNSAFSELFKPEIHIIKPFVIPPTWKICKSYDYGSSRPWACVWFAISDGSDFLVYVDKNTVEWCHSIPGDIFAIYELYGWTGRPNEGTKESIKSQAQKILEIENGPLAGRNISTSIADSAIFTNMSGAYCISDDFEENGITWERCNKYPGSREHGYALLRERLVASLERDSEPGIFWFSRCYNSIRTIPLLQMEKDGTDKVATGGASEDHIYDLTMYMLLAQDQGEVGSGSSGNY